MRSNGLDGHSETAQPRIQALRQRAHELLGTVNSLQRRCDELDHRDADGRRKQEILDKQLDALTHERDQLACERDALAAIEKELTNRHNSLQAEHNALQDLVARLQSERDTLKKEYKELADQLQASNEINSAQASKDFRNLHENCTYGDEPLAQDYFQENTLIIKKYLNRNGRNLTREAIQCCEAYCKKRIDTFDGTITLGDMCFIAIFVERIKPTTIHEIGVASGYSSGFLLNLGSALGLLSDQHAFLHSYDLLYQHSITEEGKKNIIGETVPANFPELMGHWSLNPATTSFDLEVDEPEEEYQLFFIDGGHEHPWPLIDVLNIYKKVGNKDSWVLLQDNRVIERWYQDSYRYDTEMLKPVRGIEIVYSYWPGPKVSGAGGCYNMCAINLNISRDLLSDFALNTVNYWPGLSAENNYGSEDLRNGMEKALGNYEEKIKAVIKEFV
jgi:hypothetical protein